MDIQVSSNFERYLYYKLAGSGIKVSEFMAGFMQNGVARLDFNTRGFDESFQAGSADDAETLATIRDIFEQEDYLVDPHTAGGISVGNRFRTAEIPLLCLSTAHPAKFEDAISRAVPGLFPHH